MKTLIPLLGLLLVATQANAADFNASNIYFGAGIGFNSIDNNYYDNNFNNHNDSDAVGFQIFAGLPLSVDMGSAALAVEVGYMDTGNFDNGGSANSLWSTAVASLPLNNSLKLLGRLGYDFGDDDGVMAGVGVGFSVASKMDLRIEYVIRDHIDSLQANLVFRQ
jgi:opacity protein-like surface antigen